MTDPQPSASIGAAPPRARFDAIVVPEIPVLWRTACAITGNTHEAEDLVQDTLVRAFRFIDGFDGRHPRAWLLTILRNTNLNRNRRQRPSLWPTGEVPDAAMPTVASAEDENVREHLDGPIDAALRSLSPKHARVVELVDIAGLTYDEAAAALGVPTGTVMSRLHRARRQLRAALEPHLGREGEAP